MREYSCDYRVYTRKIYIIHGKLKNFKVQLLPSNALFLCRHEDTSSLCLLFTKHATADKRTIARSTVTTFNLQSFIKPPSHGTTTTPLKHTLDSQKPTSKQDTEITPHHSATPSTKTPPNLANTSGHSRTTTLTTLFHGASYHLTLLTTAPVKDATSA